MILQPNVNTSDLIIIGRFGRPHGIKGLVTVISFAEPRENILRYMPWYISTNQEWQPIKLLHVEVNNKSILAQVDGYHEREQVARLTNIDIAVAREQLPELQPGEYYWHQLMGMSVINQQGLVLGTVTEIMPTGANDVLVVVGDKRYLIPYLIGSFIIQVDANQRQITVDWDADFI